MLNTTANLPKQPLVKLIIDGLFVLCVNKEARTAELGIYEYANEHNFFIRISKKDYNSDSVLLKDGILIRKLDDQHEVNTGDITIGVTGRPSDIACYEHSDVSNQLLLSDPQLDPNLEIEFKKDGRDKDFRWVIDLEGTRFHKRKLDVVPGVIKRKITLLNGIFYTEKLLSRLITRAYEGTPKVSGSISTPCFYFVANQLALAIEDLGEKEKLTISYTEEDEAKSITLPKLKSTPGIYYEVLISNNCPLSQKETKERQTDFQHYYNIVDVAIPERLELSALGGGGAEFVPCDLAYLGLTSELPKFPLVDDI